MDPIESLSEYQSVHAMCEIWQGQAKYKIGGRTISGELEAKQFLEEVKQIPHKGMIWVLTSQNGSWSI